MKGKLKSQVRFAQKLFHALLDDVASAHPSLVRRALDRDYQTVETRSEVEGFGFFALTLSQLGKAVLRGLETGHFECPTSFKRYKSTALPAFLRGLLELVFHQDGSLRVDSEPLAVKDLQQLTMFAYKLDIPHHPSREKAVINAFLKAEDELFTNREELTPNQSEVLDMAKTLIGSIFRRFDPMDIKPRHGPGAVATGEKFEEKWTFVRKYEDIHKVYPYYTYFIGGVNQLLDQLKWYKGLTPMKSGCAKVVLVPKDARGPRLISMEPLEYQFIQQGLRLGMQEHLEKKSHLTRGRVNFEKQDINGRLALESSVDRKYATLDMKEASDRVSLYLVEQLYSGRLLDCLKAVRTSATELPDGTIVELKKFAPMGSAVCFPVESTVFFALAVSAIVKEYGISQRAALKAVYVYGDDIIVDRRYVNALVEYFPAFGLKFNSDKCFINGYFRESCGTDAYKGLVVTPLRWRVPWLNRRQDGRTLASLTELSNAFFTSGYWRSSQLLQHCLERCYGYLPIAPVNRDTNFVALKSFSDGYRMFGKTRWNNALQAPEFKVPTVVKRLRKSKLDGWGRFLQNTLQGCVDSYAATSTAVIYQSRWRVVS